MATPKKTARQEGWKKIYGLEEAKAYAEVNGKLNRKGNSRKIWPVKGQEKKGENQKKYYWTSKIAGPDPNLLAKPSKQKRKKGNKKKQAYA